MVYTNEVLAQTYYEQALHATGLDELSMQPLAFLNMAGQYLTSMHAWRWLTVQQARLKARGNVSTTTGTWTESSATLNASNAWRFYTWLPGDLIEITGGTGTIQKYIEVTSRVDNSNIVLAESLSTAGADLAVGDIAGTIHTPTVELPADFGSFVAASASDTLVNGLELVTPAEIQRLRTNQIEVTSSWSYRGALIHTGNPPRPVLDVYPDFQDDIEDQFSCFYKRGWERLASLEDVVKIPDYIFPLFLEIVRAYALGLEDEDEMPLQMQLAKVEQGPAFKAAKAMDWRTQPHFGRMSGGMVERTGGRFGPSALSTEVAGPS